PACRVAVWPPRGPPSSSEPSAPSWVRAAGPLIGAFWLQELLGSYYGGMPAVLGESHWGTSCSRVTHRPRQNRFERRILTAATARSRQLARLLPAKNR